MIERTSFPGGGPHLEDGELVRLLDGELGPGERSVAEAHVETCDRCRSARDRTAARTARVSSALAVIDEGSANGPSAIPSPDTPSARWLRAAAIAALLVAIGALGSSTVRAWIVTRWESVQATVARVSEPAGNPRPEIAGSQAVRARFVLRSGSIVVRLERQPAGGALTVETSRDDSGSVLFISGTEEGILVLPTGLVIQNASNSRADYWLVVPAAVTSVTAIAGTDTLAVLHPGSERRRSWKIPLAEGAEAARSSPSSP